MKAGFSVSEPDKRETVFRVDEPAMKSETVFRVAPNEFEFCVFQLADSDTDPCF